MDIKYDIGIYSLVALLMNTYISHTEALCNYLSVSDVSYSVTIRGRYYYYGTCDGYPIWRQYTFYYYNQPINYITYLPKNYATSNGSAVYGWAIGPIVCAHTTFVLALNKVDDDDYDTPYDIPQPWTELLMFNSEGEPVFTSTSLDVDCYDELSGWAIFGIVLGSLCGLTIVIFLIMLICSKAGNKRNNNRTPANNEPVVYTTSNSRYMDPHTYAEITLPPSYDNSPPPAYDAAVFPQNPPAAGHANIGYNC